MEAAKVNAPHLPTVRFGIECFMTFLRFAAAVPGPT
jgi:hypothetical protein